MAERFKRKWFGSRPAELGDVEKELWHIVEKATVPVEVLYGSDIDTRVYGSGFPRLSDAVRTGCDPDEWAAYTKNPWNLNNFPKLRGSMLRMVQDNIPGVIVPWLYVGMLFSSFCWHYEDHCFYSVNYLHQYGKL
jgi:histone demethylase JARID1